MGAVQDDVFPGSLFFRKYITIVDNKNKDFYSSWGWRFPETTINRIY